MNHDFHRIFLLKVVSGRLAEIQSAFMSLLGDGNDLVQDAASKGLGIVYEACSGEQRDAMVGHLLTTLLEGNKTQTQKVNFLPLSICIAIFDEPSIVITTHISSSI